MSKDLNLPYFLKLTLAVYKVTGLFPEGGRALQAQIRESANKVLADLLLDQTVQVNGLLELFQVAAEKDWVDPRNFLVLRKEYGKMQGLFSESGVRPKTTRFNNGRQKSIYNILRGKKKIQVKELMPSFPGISRRTLIRDLEELCQAGSIARNGNGAGTSYIVTES